MFGSLFKGTPLFMICVFYYYFEWKTTAQKNKMGKEEAGTGAGIVVFLFLIGTGILQIYTGVNDYLNDNPKVKEGYMNQYDQTYVCPGVNSRNGKVKYKGDDGLVATLTRDLPTISRDFKLTTVNKSGFVVKSDEKLFHSFQLIKGSKVQWSIKATGKNQPVLYFYQKRNYLCSGDFCIPYVKTVNDIFSGEYTVDDDYEYIIEIAPNKTDTTVTLSECIFKAYHLRYYTEDEEIEHSNGDKTFSFPKEGDEYYGCVFVEYPQSGKTTDQTKHFSLTYYLTRDAMKKELASHLVVGIGAIVAVILLIVIALCCFRDK